MSDLLRHGNMTRRQFFKLAELLAGSAALATLAACGRGTAASVWKPDVAGLKEPSPYCRPDPFAHVRRPTRLISVADCASVSGTVRRVAFDPHDGDHRIWVEPDADYRRLLAPSNGGLLMAVVIAVDEPTVYLPTVGEHATFYGSMVLNRGQNHSVELHPCWLITTPQVQGPLETSPTLTVEISAADRVPVGQQWPVQIRVTGPAGGLLQPVSQAHLFLELISETHGAVRWIAASTNTLGIAALTLASLVQAGSYRLHVYAAKERTTGFAEHAVKIARR